MLHSGATCIRTLAAALLLALVGCAQAPRVVVPNPVKIDVTEYPRIYRTAMAVLHEQGFVLDRENYRFGRLTTLPLASPTVFEPWRSLNTTAYQAWQATVNYQRRIVVIGMTPVYPSAGAAPASGPSLAQAAPQPPVNPAPVFQLSVHVNIQQAQLPNCRLGGQTVGPGIINIMGDTPAEWRALGVKGPYWQTIGRDPYLEQRILAMVIRRATEAADVPLPPASVATAQPSPATISNTP